MKNIVTRFVKLTSMLVLAYVSIPFSRKKYLWKSIRNNHLHEVPVDIWIIHTILLDNKINNNFMQLSPVTEEIYFKKYNSLVELEEEVFFSK